MMTFLGVIGGIVAIAAVIALCFWVWIMSMRNWN